MISRKLAFTLIASLGLTSSVHAEPSLVYEGPAGIELSEPLAADLANVPY